MYGREELEVKELIDGNGFGYSKDEADKVMDAMEARIKELESKLYGNNGETTRLLNRINNFFTEDVKAKNIIEECYTCIHQLLSTISKMETTTPKWISVEDALPQWGKLVKIKFKNGKEDERRFSADYKWVSKGMQTCESVYVTHWLPLPPPPTTEKM